MKIKRILSVVLAIIMSIGIVGISDVNKANASTTNKEIYDIGGLGEYGIYLGGNKTIDVVYFDENMELIMNPDLSNYSILWEKFNKNTNNWEYYSNNRKLEIINAKKEDFTKYRIILTNKKENGYSPYPYYLTINEVSRSDYEKETTTEEPTSTTEVYKSKNKNFANNCKVKGLNKNYNYTNKEIKPSIKIYSESLDGDYYSAKLDPKYYTLTYKNNVKPGKASIIITGKAPYFGTKVVTFNIKPANSKVVKVKIKNKKLKLLAKKLNVMVMNLDTKNQLLNGVNQSLNQDGKQKLKKVINLHQRSLKKVITLYR